MELPQNVTEGHSQLLGHQSVTSVLERKTKNESSKRSQEKAIVNGTGIRSLLGDLMGPAGLREEKVCKIVRAESGRPWNTGAATGWLCAPQQGA